MSDDSLRIAIAYRMLRACHNPQIRAESERLIRLSEQTGKSIHELEGGTPATQEDMDKIAFGAQFNFPEVSG